MSVPNISKYFLIQEWKFLCPVLLTFFLCLNLCHGLYLFATVIGIHPYSLSPHCSSKDNNPSLIHPEKLYFLSYYFSCSVSLLTVITSMFAFSWFIFLVHTKLFLLCQLDFPSQSCHTQNHHHQNYYFSWNWNHIVQIFLRCWINFHQYHCWISFDKNYNYDPKLQVLFLRHQFQNPCLTKYQVN